jgi:hypothetical protein
MSVAILDLATLVLALLVLVGVAALFRLANRFVERRSAEWEARGFDRQGPPPGTDIKDDDKEASREVDAGA